MSKKRSKAKPARAPRRAAAKRSSATDRKEEKAFIKSLVTHRQAVKLAPGEKLPPGATHELVSDKSGEVKVVRKRFTAF